MSGDETASEIIARLRGRPDGREGWHAQQQLARLGPAAVPDLIAALDFDDPAVRAAVARALGDIGPPARAAADALLRRLFDPETRVRDAAAAALCRISPPLKRAAPLICGRITAEQRRGVLGRLLRVAGNIGPAAGMAAPAARAALGDDDLFPDALYALRSIAPGDPALLDALREQLRGGPHRALAAETVGRLRLSGREWLDALRATSTCADYPAQHAARAALRRLRAG